MYQGEWRSLGENDQRRRTVERDMATLRSQALNVDGCFPVKRVGLREFDEARPALGDESLRDMKQRSGEGSH